MKTVLVCPDGLSVVLFCREILRTLLGRGETVVAADAGVYGSEIEQTGARVRDVPIGRYANPLLDSAYAWRLYRAFSHERPDAVLNFSTKPNIYGTIAARAAGVPTVVSHVVGLGSVFSMPNGPMRWGLERVVLALYRWSARLNDRIWFTSPSDLAFFKASGLITDEQAVLTRNYLDTDAYAADTIAPSDIEEARRGMGLKPGETVAIMVARLIWSKGVREFVEAAEHLRDRLPNARFLLVAPEEQGSAEAVPAGWVDAAVARLGNLRWLGFRRDVPRLYALADVAVLPSYYREGGYPRALLEPMSMGKPVVTTDTDGCRGAVEDGRNGFLVPPRDSVALADAIHRLLSAPDRLEAFGLRSRVKAVTEFDEKVIVPEALRALGLA